MWNPYDELSAKERRLYGLVSVGTVLLIWSVLTFGSFVRPTKLPSIVQVFEGFTYLAWNEATETSPLFLAVKSSVLRVLVASVLVVSIGVPIGVFMGASPKINAVLSPLLDPLRSAPVVAILPILVMWMGIGELMKITFLFIGAVVFLIPMVRDAMLAVSQQYWIAARDLGATEWEAVRHAVLPMAMPRIADAIVVAVSVMWTYITVAEYVNAETGLGQIITHARRQSAMNQVFVAIGVIIGLALLTYVTMMAIKRKIYPWESE